MPRPALSGDPVIVITCVAIILVVLFIASGLHKGQFSARPAGPLLIHYHYTAESVYEDIVVNETMLVHTYFSDTSRKCDQWIRQAPCWDEQDLRVAEYPLSVAETEAIRSTLRSSGFMDLNGTYGGAGDHQRYYPVAITAAEGGVERTVVSQNSPDTDPEPAAFTLVKDAVIALKNQKESGG
jgi:hypothetical protein